jgi:hypothetical protein
LVWKISQSDIRRLYLASVSHSVTSTGQDNPDGVTPGVHVDHFIAAADKYIIPKLYWGAREVREIE